MEPQAEVATESRFENVVKVLGGETLPDGSDSFVKAWHSIAQDFSSLNGKISSAFFSRFSSTFAKWIQAAIKEKRIFQGDPKLLQQLPISFFLEQRINTIGMFSESLFLELTCGFEFPSIVHTHPIFLSLVKLSGLLVGISNEIVSVAKDAAGVDRWSNVVLIHQQQNRCSIEESFRWIVDLHEEAIAQFDSLASPESLQRWVPQEWIESGYLPSSSSTFYSRIRILAHDNEAIHFSIRCGYSIFDCFHP